MKHHNWYWLFYPWALPMTLIGIVVAVLTNSHSWRWNDGCLEVVSSHLPMNSFAWTWGWLIIYSDKNCRQNSTIRTHERVHVVQNLICGPLFPAIYALNFFAYLLITGDWAGSYRWIWFEQQAQRLHNTPGAWGQPAIA